MRGAVRAFRARMLEGSSRIVVLATALCVTCASGMLVACTSANGAGGQTPLATGMQQISESVPPSTDRAAVPASAGGDELTVPTAEAGDAKVSRIEQLVVGTTDYTNLDWHVSCSGLATSPAVIASAKDGVTNLTVVLLGADPKQLNSFTLALAEQGNRVDSGLNVYPMASQGEGTMSVRDAVITSHGHGVLYGPAQTSATTDSAYELRVSCAEG